MRQWSCTRTGTPTGRSTSGGNTPNLQLSGWSHTLLESRPRGARMDDKDQRPSRKIPPRRGTRMQRGGQRTKKRMSGRHGSVTIPPKTRGTIRLMRRSNGPSAMIFEKPKCPNVKMSMTTADTHDRGRRRVSCDLPYAPAPHTYAHADSYRSRMGGEDRGTKPPTNHPPAMGARDPRRPRDSSPPPFYLFSKTARFGQ